MSAPDHYDVFLSHASADKPSVEALALRLQEDDLRPFLDSWDLVPGELWQKALEDALAKSRTCAIVVGSEETAPWREREMRVALDQQAKNPDFRVIPVLLPGARRPALPAFLGQLTWVEFRAVPDDDEAYRRLVSGIRGQAPGSGNRGTARPTSPHHPSPILPSDTTYRSMATPPDGFVHRHELDEVAARLTDAPADADAAVGITTALRGAGGFGKTTLAQALAHDERIRAAFPDGVLWTTMGNDLRDGDRLHRIADLIRWWEGQPEQSPAFDSVAAAGAYLRTRLAGARVLVVLDDVWSPADVEPFRGLGEGAALLITTRDRQTLPAQCERVDVDAMRRAEAVELLTDRLGHPDGDLFEPLAERLGEWPLLLKLVNRQLRDLVDGGLDPAEAIAEVEEALDEGGLTVFDRSDEKARELAVQRTLKVSLERLAEDERRRFFDLAVFPEDTDIPLAVVERFWSLRSFATKQLCERLEVLSLLLRFDRRAGTLRLHDVFRQYLLGRHDDLPGLHRSFLGQCCPAGGLWLQLDPGDGYLWRHLAYHLAAAEEEEVLRRMLFDFTYLRSKLAATDVNALLADYDFLPGDGEARDVQGALRLSAHVLAQDPQPQQLAGQLLGRLLGRREERIRGLLDAAARTGGLRPRFASLVSPGGPLFRTLEGHAWAVTAVAVLDENRVVSASEYKTLRVWDLVSGETIRTLKGHTSGVGAAAVLNENRVVSASGDHTMRVWDLASGETIHTLKGHTSGVGAVAVLDENRVVSASSDKTLRVWDLDAGRDVAVFTLEAPALTVACAGGRVVVAGDSVGGVHFLEWVDPSPAVLSSTS